MKRGIIRIIAGIVMIVLQVLAIGQSSVYHTYDINVRSNVGFYSVGVAGAILLFYGVRACSGGLCSQLILHNKTKTLHAVARWVMFSISTFLLVFYVISFINSWPDINVFTILMIFATLSFAVYMLLYVYKKPCCLFSTALIFTGFACLFSSLTLYTSFLLDIDNYGIYVIFKFVPNIIAGVLYIIIAVKLYKEDFSVNVIKVLGWTAFALEFINRVLCDLIIFKNFYFYNLSSVLFVLLTVGILLYTSVFEMNTLKESVVVDNDDAINLCRKCGAQLLDGSKFCRKCVAETVEKRAVTIVGLDNIELCKKCGADITHDTATCHVCGEQVRTDMGASRKN